MAVLRRALVGLVAIAAASPPRSSAADDGYSLLSRIYLKSGRHGRFVVIVIDVSTMTLRLE